MPTQFDFTDLQLGATETDYTDIGDIVVPLNCSRITGICAEIGMELGYTTLGMLGIARLRWTGGEEMDGVPVGLCQSTAGGQVFYKPKFVPVNIPVKAGLTEVECSIKTTIAPTGTTMHGKVCLRFE